MTSLIGDEICARVEAWCVENLDGEEIDRTETIPAHVWRGLKELNLFAIKIPTKYNGLGMSQTNYAHSQRRRTILRINCSDTIRPPIHWSAPATEAARYRRAETAFPAQNLLKAGSPHLH